MKYCLFLFAALFCSPCFAQNFDAHSDYAKDVLGAFAHWSFEGNFVLSPFTDEVGGVAVAQPYGTFTAEEPTLVFQDTDNSLLLESVASTGVRVQNVDRVSSVLMVTETVPGEVTSPLSVSIYASVADLSLEALTGSPLECDDPLIGNQVCAGLFRRCGNGQTLNIVLDQDSGTLRVDYLATTGTGYLLQWFPPASFDETVAHHYVTVFDPGVTNGQRLYVDGVLVAQQDANSFWFECGNGSASQPWYFGTTADTPVLPEFAPGCGGHIDEISLFAASLSDSDVLELYTRGIEGAPFIRGDATGNGVVNLSDAIAIAGVQNGTTNCFRAADANGDGSIGVADSIYVLNYAFSGGGAPPAPFPLCGRDGPADLCGTNFCP